jgi:tRNA modification GTPase
MYRLDDTIVAIASPRVMDGQLGRTLIRISGKEAFSVFRRVGSAHAAQLPSPLNRGIYPLRIQLPRNIEVDGLAYAFPSPASYTGQDLLELHLTAAPSAVEAVYQQVILSGIRQAQPGEFTQRAYLNGKLDLTQAEAVMHIVSASNAGQIAAAERLLSGGLAAKITQLQNEILELLSLVEAGLDFAEEAIEFVTPTQATSRIANLRERIEQLLDGAVRCEELMGLPSVGLAGLPNAGKSSLMNTLTAQQRSIVSDVQGTTRDVLTETLDLDCGQCVLFDCAGLKLHTTDAMEQLAHQAAASALSAASIILFCIDLSLNNLEQAAAIFRLFPKTHTLGIATKSDLYPAEQIEHKLKQLNDIFGIEFVPVSTKTSAGLGILQNKLTQMLLSAQSGQNETDVGVAINLRHRQKLQSALKHLSQAADEIYNDHPEIAAMSLRQTRQELGGLEHEAVDERILDVIFSKFCIGK